MKRPANCQCTLNNGKNRFGRLCSRDVSRLETIVYTLIDWLVTRSASLCCLANKIKFYRDYSARRKCTVPQRYFFANSCSMGMAPSYARLRSDFVVVSLSQSRDSPSNSQFCSLHVEDPYSIILFIQFINQRFCTQCLRRIVLLLELTQLAPLCPIKNGLNTAQSIPQFYFFLFQ